MVIELKHIYKEREVIIRLFQFKKNHKIIIILEHVRVQMIPYISMWRQHQETERINNGDAIQLFGWECD